MKTTTVTIASVALLGVGFMTVAYLEQKRIAAAATARDIAVNQVIRENTTSSGSSGGSFFGGLLSTFGSTVNVLLGGGS